MYIRIYWKVISWSLLMLIVFLAPASDLPEGPEIPFLDKSVHIVLFAVFTFMVFHARMQHKGIRIIRFPLFLNILLVTIIFGASVELAQSFMDLGREGDFYDFAADLAGYILGFTSIIIYKKTG